MGARSAESVMLIERTVTRHRSEHPRTKDPKVAREQDRTRNLHHRSEGLPRKVWSTFGGPAFSVTTRLRISGSCSYVQAFSGVPVCLQEQVEAIHITYGCHNKVHPCEEQEQATATASEMAPKGPCRACGRDTAQPWLDSLPWCRSCYPTV
jgi:hypothetical protein